MWCLVSVSGAGELLAKIDDTDLKNTLIRTEASLASLEAQIASETAPPLAGDIAAAEANLQTAHLELSDLLTQPSEDTITQTRRRFTATGNCLAPGSGSL